MQQVLRYNVRNFGSWTQNTSWTCSVHHVVCVYPLSYLYLLIFICHFFFVSFLSPTNLYILSLYIHLNHTAPFMRSQSAFEMNISLKCFNSFIIVVLMYFCCICFHSFVSCFLVNLNYAPECRRVFHIIPSMRVPMHELTSFWYSVDVGNVVVKSKKIFLKAENDMKTANRCLRKTKLFFPSLKDEIKLTGKCSEVSVLFTEVFILFTPTEVKSSSLFHLMRLDQLAH